MEQYKAGDLIKTIDDDDEVTYFSEESNEDEDVNIQD